MQFLPRSISIAPSLSLLRAAIDQPIRICLMLFITYSSWPLSLPHADSPAQKSQRPIRARALLSEAVITASPVQIEAQLELSPSSPCSLTSSPLSRIDRGSLSQTITIFRIRSKPTTTITIL